MIKSKKIIMLMLVLILMFCMPNICFADGPDLGGEATFDGTINPNTYKPGELTDVGTISKIGNIIVGAIRIIGSGISVIALAVIGIKYIMGTAEDKAQYKETIAPYLVGIALLFGGSNIIAIIYDIARGL